jgi:proline iminopeptidase
MADPTLSRRLRKLEVPTLVLHGDDDPLPADGATELARMLPSAHLELLPGMGHTPWLEDPAMVRQAVRRFIKAMPGGRTTSRRLGHRGHDRSSHEG